LSIFGPHDILFKRSSFSWEQEYRFWIDDDELVQRIEAEEEIREQDLSSGRPVGISDMQRLIKKIVVAPGASDEFIEQVRLRVRAPQTLALECHQTIASDRMWDSFNLRVSPQSKFMATAPTRDEPPITSGGEGGGEVVMGERGVYDGVAVLGQERRLHAAWDGLPAVEEENFHADPRSASPSIRAIRSTSQLDSKPSDRTATDEGHSDAS
jgi:hypothetical protein